jgi:two-component system, OmpR family, alkaline phosphatase synthesis response regulator PhoP
VRFTSAERPALSLIPLRGHGSAGGRTDVVLRKVLVIEDNADLAAGISYNLQKERLDVRVAETGTDGLRYAREWRPDVIILDLMLPDLDGLELLARLRQTGDRTPVLILTAKDQEADKIKGFHLDADQYVTKPFSLRELLARVHSLLRRAEVTRSPEPIWLAFGRVEVDLARREVCVGGQAALLTPKAFDLLVALIRREGAVASRAELLREVWGHRAVVMTRTVDAHVAELRRKLEKDPANPEHVLTVWKVGYRLQR